MCKKCSEKFTTFLLNPKITQLKTAKPTSKNSNNLKLWKKVILKSQEKPRPPNSPEAPSAHNSVYALMRLTGA